MHTVLQRFRDVNMRVKPSKCEAAKAEIQVLGRRARKRLLLSQGQSSGRTSIPDLLVCQGNTLGLYPTSRSWHCHFDLVKKSVPNNVDWVSSGRQVVLYPQVFVGQGTCLAVTKPFEAIILRTDALSEGLSAILLQKKGSDVFPIIYHSRKLKQAEKNYSTNRTRVTGNSRWRQEVLFLHVWGWVRTANGPYASKVSVYLKTCGLQNNEMCSVSTGI